MRSAKEKFTWISQNLEKILIVFFFLTFTLNIRKVYLTKFSFLNGGFNEYLTMSMGWADLLMIAVIFIYTIKFCYSQFFTPRETPAYEYNNRNYLSIFSPSYVSRETYFLILFIVWAGLSIFWAKFQPIALYRLIIFIEIALFTSIAVKTLKSLKWLRMGLLAVIINGLFQSTLGIAQFIHNRSLGLHAIGESQIGPNIDGVAKIFINGVKHIRAYGTFPHPNILAGFLLIPLFIVVSELISRGKSMSTESNADQTFPFSEHGGHSRSLLQINQPFVSHETLFTYIPDWMLWSSLAIILMGLITTFSRSAFVGGIIGLLLYFVWIIRGRKYIIWQSARPKSSSSWFSNISNIFKFILLIISLIVLAYILLKFTSIISNQSLEERKLYQNVSYETIIHNPIDGTGIGQFVYFEYLNHPSLTYWQYQPVHNVFLLILSEVGFIGLALYILFLSPILLYKYSSKASEKILTYYSFYCMLISSLIISLFDHYYWDIKLGTLIFVLPFIIIRVFMDLGS